MGSPWTSRTTPWRASQTTTSTASRRTRRRRPWPWRSSCPGRRPPANTTFTGTTVSGIATMDVVGGKLKIVQDPDVTIEVNGLNVKMENLFGGEADGLAKVVLRFVNKESDKFIKDFQPEIAKQVSQLIKTFFNSALDNIPVDTFQ